MLVVVLPAAAGHGSRCLKTTEAIAAQTPTVGEDASTHFR
jgi:hypothetical protein